ncbi:MAG TPA: 1-acyl-sn-glycerol-3-phosphate acyltransferase, partial [Chroococcidiopsis sp.]
MSSSRHRAHPPLEFIPQRFNPLVWWAMQAALPVLLRAHTRPWLPAGIAQVETHNVETLVELYRQFQAGKIRFLMAFRHPEVDDPLSMLHLLSRAVPQTARQQGIALRSPVHSHFIYERGMTIWAGEWLGWLFSRMGGFPIHRGKRLDRVGLKTARHLFAHGRFPITVAPEGATNGHSETVSPLEPGVARLGFWCVEDLLKANRPETVLIVPIGIQYRYVKPPWARLDWLLRQLEAETGLSVQSDMGAILAQPETRETKTREAIVYERLLRLSERVLTLMEAFYRRFYHQELPDVSLCNPIADPLGNPIVNSTVNSMVDSTANPTDNPTANPTANSPTDPAAQLHVRLQVLLDVALRVPERHFALASEGTLIDRCRRLEEASWNDIYRDDLPDLGVLSPLERGLADWLAEESALAIRHMRLVESFVAVTSRYLQEKPTVERFAELALLLFDLVARLRGDKLPQRPRLGWRRSHITIGEPISVSDRWPDYCAGRQSAKAAVTTLTEDLQRSLQGL